MTNERSGFAASPDLGPIPSIAVRLPQPAQTGVTMPDIPSDLRYSPDHLWGRPGVGLVRIGVTDFAQQSLGDVVDVTLPRIGETIKTSEACGDIESVKSVSDLIAPVTGTIRRRNDDLTRTPELVLDPGAYHELVGA